MTGKDGKALAAYLVVDDHIHVGVRVVVNPFVELHHVWCRNGPFQTNVHLAVGNKSAVAYAHIPYFWQCSRSLSFIAAAPPPAPLPARRNGTQNKGCRAKRCGMKKPWNKRLL